MFLALDGVPAVDGLLEEEEGGFYLRSSGGERIQLALAGIPGALVSHIGDHIWVAGDLDRGIEAFGLIWSGGFWGDSGWISYIDHGRYRPCLPDNRCYT